MGTNIASEQIQLIFPDGTRRAVDIEIGCPYVDEEGVARCPVGMKGLYPRLPDVAGTSTLHALLLAFRLVHNLLKSKLEEGVSLAFFDPGHPDKCDETFVLDDFFGAQI
jgi:hypothetical protein